jgi:hypothetical protein
MANGGEPPYTSLMVSKPKVLTGLDQTVRGRYRSASLSCRRHTATGEQAGPNPSGYERETW